MHRESPAIGPDEMERSGEENNRDGGLRSGCVHAGQN